MVYNTDDCRVVCYDVTLSYVTMDDHVTKSVMVTMNSLTITELSDDTHINITVIKRFKDNYVRKFII